MSTGIHHPKLAPALDLALSPTLDAIHAIVTADLIARFTCLCRAPERVNHVPPKE